MKKMTIRLEDYVYDRVNLIASETKMSANKLITNIITNDLNKNYNLDYSKEINNKLDYLLNDISVIKKQQHLHFLVSKQHFVNHGYLFNADIDEDKRLKELFDNNNFSNEGLCYLCKEGKLAVDSAIKELKLKGYLKLTRKQKEDGKFYYDYDDLGKLKILIYIFNLLNNNLINDKNVENPDLMEDDINIFNLTMIGLSTNTCTILLQYFSMLYNIKTDGNNSYEDNGYVYGIEYLDKDNELNSKFGKLNYNEKLDVFREIIIRYDNETYFEEKITNLTFDSKYDGFFLAELIERKKV